MCAIRMCEARAMIDSIQESRESGEAKKIWNNTICLQRNEIEKSYNPEQRSEMEGKNGRKSAVLISFDMPSKIDEYIVSRDIQGSGRLCVAGGIGC